MRGRWGEHPWRTRLVRWLTPRSLEAVRKRRVKNRLLHGQDADEDIVDEVYHHPVVYARALGEALLAALVAASSLRAVGDGAALLLVVGLGILVHAGYLWFVQFLDVFVITNVRMLRVSGIINIKQASTPVSRILDITLKQPLLGRVMDYGHFVFESAAQEQGLRDIRFVPRPLVLNEKIQTLQMDLLTGRRGTQDSELEDEAVAPVDLDP
jgi:hypothetical protein